MNKRVQCEAHPADGLIRHWREVHGRKPSECRREPNEDALTCIECDVTFVGGPTDEPRVYR